MYLYGFTSFRLMYGLTFIFNKPRCQCKPFNLLCGVCFISTLLSLYSEGCEKLLNTHLALQTCDRIHDSRGAPRSAVGFKANAKYGNIFRNTLG